MISVMVWEVQTFILKISAHSKNLLLVIYFTVQEVSQPSYITQTLRIYHNPKNYRRETKSNPNNLDLLSEPCGLEGTIKCNTEASDSV